MGKRIVKNGHGKSQRVIPEDIARMIRENRDSGHRRAAMSVSLRLLTDAFTCVGASDIDCAEACEGEAARMRERHEAMRLANRVKK
jgi:hypothetical protein